MNRIASSPTTAPPHPSRRQAVANPHMTANDISVQLDHLRTIPSGIVRALGATHLTPEEYFKNFLVPTHGGSRSLNKFATEWHGPPLRRIVDHARVREREDPDLSAGLSVPKYGWAALVSGEDGRVKQKEGEGRRTAKGEVEALVKGFRDANEKVKVEFDAVTLVIKVSVGHGVEILTWLTDGDRSN